MIRGIYCSNTGLNAMQQKIDTIAHNLANVNTEGFKEEKVAFKTFQQEVNGVLTAQISTDYCAGDLRPTERAGDFAIQGNAFFKIDTPDGFRYVRNGSFNSDESGYLTDSQGNKVVGVSGEVKLVNGQPDQDFYLASFENQAYLNPSATGFSAADEAGISQAQNIPVLQGFLETSNVDLLQNMTDMIATARIFSLNSKMLMSQDEMLKKAVDEVGMLK